MPCIIQYFLWFMHGKLCFCLFVKVFISPSILKVFLLVINFLAGISFKSLKPSFYHFHTSLVPIEKPSISLIFVPFNFCSSIFSGYFYDFLSVFDSLQVHYYASVCEFLFILFGISWT